MKGNSWKSSNGGINLGGIGSAVVGAVAGRVYQKGAERHTERLVVAQGEQHRLNVGAETEATMGILDKLSGIGELHAVNVHNTAAVFHKKAPAKKAAAKKAAAPKTAAAPAGNPDNDVVGQPSASDPQISRVDTQFPASATPTPAAPRASKSPKADKPKATKSRTTKKAAANTNNVVIGSLSDDIAAAQERDTAKKTASKKTAAPAAKKTTAKAPAKGKKA